MNCGHVFQGEKYRSACGEDDGGDRVEFKKTLFRLGGEEIHNGSGRDRKGLNRVNVEPRRKQIDCMRVICRRLSLVKRRLLRAATSPVVRKISKRFFLNLVRGRFVTR